MIRRSLGCLVAAALCIPTIAIENASGATYKRMTSSANRVPINRVPISSVVSRQHNVRLPNTARVRVNDVVSRKHGDYLPGYRPFARPLNTMPNNKLRPARWRPGGAVAAGAAIGFVSAVTAAAWAGPPPAAGYCWYYTDASRRRGFWDLCP